MPIDAQQLIAYLETQKTASVTLSFAQIEAIVGPLPRRALHSTRRWAAAPQDRFRLAHIYAWFRAGYVADVPDFGAGTVTFRRLAPPLSIEGRRARR